MAKPGFYNENINISYPLIFGEDAPFPSWLIADFGCIMLPGSGFDADEHTVKLTRVNHFAWMTEFIFTTDAPGLLGQALVFRITHGEDDYTTLYAESTGLPYDPTDSNNPGDSSSDSSLCDDPVWEGWLVVGDVSKIANGDDITGAAPVEPALIQSLEGGYVSSLNLANTERTRATTPEDCRDYCWPFVPEDVYVRTTCLVGDIRLKTGYNSDLGHDPLSNTLTLHARVGAGEGEPCGDTKLTDDEAPPTGRTTYDGAPRCDEIVRSINGVTKQFFTIGGGSGVTVTPVPSEHKVIIDMGLKDLALCPDLSEESSYEGSSFGPDPCDCGPTP